MSKRILIAVLLIILALPTAGLLFLFYSEAGLQLLLSQLPRFAGLSIAVEGAQGRLAGPLSIRRLELKLEHIQIVVDNLHADLSPQALLTGVVEVRTLSADRVDVRMTGNTQKSTTPPRFLPGNLRIKVDQAQLRGVNFVYAQTRPFTADRLSGSVWIERQRLRVNSLHAAAPDFEFDGSVDLQARAALQLDIAADGHYLLGANRLEGHAQLKGVPSSLEAQAQLTAPSVLDARAKLEFPEGSWKISGSARSPAFDLKPWWRQAPFGLRNADVTFNADPKTMSVDGELAIPELGALPLRLKAEGSYGERVLRIRSAEVSGKSGALRVNAEGEFHLDEQPTLRAAAHWRGLSWPLTGEPTAALLASNNGSLNIEGNLPYRFSIEAAVSSARLPAAGTAQFSAAGAVSKESLVLSQYRLAALDGAIDGNGQLAFAQPQNWSLQVDARDLNPMAIHADFPGRVALRATAQGRGLNKQTSFAVQLAELGGTLRSKPLRGRGTVEYAPQVWRAKQLQLNFGSTQLHADGSFGKQLAFTAELRSNDMRELDFGGWKLSGKAELQVQAQGPWKTPRLIAKANSTEFDFGDWQARMVKLDADVDLADRRESRIDATAGRVIHGDYALDELHVGANGLLSAHNIAVSSGLGTLKSRAVTLAAELDGKYVEQSWSGRLVNANVTDADKRERAHVLQPVAVHAAPTQAEMGEFCFAFDDSRSCMQGSWQRRGSWKVVASINNFPLSVLNSERAESLRYAGHLAAHVDLGAAAGEPWQGSADMQLIDATVGYFSSSGRYESLPIDTARLDIAAAARKLTGTLTINAGQTTRVNANAEWTQNPNALITQWPLQAQMQLHSMDAKLLPLLVSNVDRVSGNLDADMRVTGSLAQPQLQGSVQLQQGEADLYQLNLALREMSFLAKLDDNRLQLEGSARAGDGMLNVKGGFAWNDLKTSGNLRIKGNQLLVADLPEYRVVASPDLTFVVTDTHIDVVGDIVIPSARLQPQNVSGAVQTSSDARLLTDQALTGQNSWTISSEVRVSMGDDVQVDALGLQGRLTGSVGTTFQPGNPAIGRGELSIQNGLYEAYGRKLDVTRGRLLFEAASLDDPGLDVQAERKIEDTTVGVYVRGTLRAPRLQFYSDPSMSQTEIVSYLLIGKPLDQLQGSETTTVKSASNTLAVQGGGYVAAQLGRRIGLEQVGVETDTNNQSSLVLGKFLSPRLFLSYGISLTQAINTLKLRYTINNHWLLKTESGNAQSADVEFKIER